VGLCEVVGLLAEAVAAKYIQRSEWDNLLIHILRSAPIYRDAGRLDAWDEAFRDARGDVDRSSPIVVLLDAIADLGSYNMYGAFDLAGTQQEYSRVVQTLEAEGVVIPPCLDFSDW
jgi:hypothetical protein